MRLKDSGRVGVVRGISPDGASADVALGSEDGEGRLRMPGISHTAKTARLPSDRLSLIPSLPAALQRLMGAPHASCAQKAGRMLMRCTAQATDAGSSAGVKHAYG